MSVTTTFLFDTTSNYTYPATVEISGGQANLLIGDNTGQTFNEDFADDTGFTYDSDYTEFSGGQVQQIDSQPTNSVSWSTFETDINLNFGGGVLTGTASGGAAISGNKLDLNYSDIRFVSFSAASNVTPQQTGCIKFKYTPNYNGTPAATCVMFAMNESVVLNNNELTMYHQAGTGDLRFNQRNAAGTSQAGGGALWAPTLGTEYEIEFNYDITTGNCRVFIDGVLHSSDLVTTGTRSAAIGHFAIGSNWQESTTSNFSIADFIVFDTVQHTSGYVSGYTLEEYRYNSDVITLPVFIYSGVGDIQAFTNIVSTEGNTPRYIMNGQYYSGGWVASSDTFATASSLATILTNIATLPAADTITIKIATENSNTVQMSVDDLTLTYTGQIYPTTDPTVEINSSLGMEELLTFVETSSKTGSDEIKYILKKGSIWYYYSGGWIATNETYAQSNTAAEITTNIASFVADRTDVKIKLFLHSDDGSTTPSIQELSLTYDFGGETQDALSICAVYFYSRHPDGTINTDDVTATLTKSGVKYKNNVVIDDVVITSTPDESTGYVELNLIENVNMSISTGVNITYHISQSNTAVAQISVPDQAGAVLWEITV